MLAFYRAVSPSHWYLGYLLYLVIFVIQTFAQVIFNNLFLLALSLLIYNQTSNCIYNELSVQYPKNILAREIFFKSWTRNDKLTVINTRVCRTFIHFEAIFDRYLSTILFIYSTRPSNCERRAFILIFQIRKRSHVLFKTATLQFLS